MLFPRKYQEIAFYLSNIFPIEVCLHLTMMIKLAEVEDARKEHMNDCLYYRILKQFSTKNDKEIVNKIIKYQGYSPRIFKHVDADGYSDHIPYNIKRLAQGNQPYVYEYILYDENIITNYISNPYSLLNESNNVLITNTVSGALLKRIKKDKKRDMFYKTYDNKYQSYQTCYHTYINEIEKKDSKNIILINIKNNPPVNYFYHKKDNKKKIHFNKKSRMMHQHRPSKKHCKN
jgi:hypothetical protein